MTIPTFQTSRLILRGIELSDAPSYQKNFANYDVIQYLSSRVPWPYPENGVELFIKDFVLPNQGKTRWSWGIFLSEQPEEVIGVIEIFNPGIPEHRGFWLSKDHWGKGLMSEAIAPVMNFAYTTLGMESLILSNAVENTRSRRVKERSGATFLYTRPASFSNPQYTHSEYWQLTREVWLSTGPSI
ncbi:MAG TPA: GNAT family N-acetyltransferase [Bacteriovoracaceae bacterium]|nr:GNAT family N-acetyltransferase [Bacteriovoracaceae bacterium]